MKGLRYEQQVAGDMRDVQNRRTFVQQRLAVPDAKLTIFSHKGEMIATDGVNIPEDTQTIEVEVPDELIVAARELIRAKIELNDLKDTFRSTINSG